jgi:S1-C subfamily serine protease
MKRFAFPLICLAAAFASPLLAELPATQPTTMPSAVAPASAILCPAAEALQDQVMKVAPKCVANTVGLVTRTSDMMGIASGSGVLVSADGLVLTAGHVIEKPGNPLTIRFPDGRVVQGVAVGLDHATDTGLAKITDPAPAGGWPFSPIAPDDSANIGEWVLATGNPGSVVVGRNPPLRIGRVTLHGARNLETNCALEPGDSGGPVFDLQGRVVGINSRIMTSSGNVPPKEYLSMHVPVSQFATEWKDLLAGENANPNVVLGRQQGRGRGRNGNGARFREAMNKLVAAKDPEVLKLLADAQSNGGRMNLTPELMRHLIEKAGMTQRPSTQPTTAPAGVALAPVTRPTSAPAALAMAPVTQPTTAPVVERGIAAAFRPRLMADVRKTLLQQFPGANISDALVNRIMDHSSYNPTTRKLSVITDERDLRDMGITPAAIASRLIPSNRAALEAGKTSLDTLSLFVPALNAAGGCVVTISAKEQPVLLGTIVASNGYIVTKASDLPDHPIVTLPDGRAMSARLVGRDSATDIALLKVAAHGLTAVQFTDHSPLGTWLAAPTADPDQPAIGVVSDSARPIPEKFAHFEGEQKLVLGVGFAGPSLVLGMISPGMPAEIAGLKIGDEVTELDGTAVKDVADFLARMKKHTTGDTVIIKVHRGDQDLELRPLLGKAKSTTQTANGIGEADNVAGGKLSKRRTNFPLAIQTDTAIWANQCGGPLINLQGQTVGVTIARYDRVCTFAIPSELVQQTIAKLKGN